MCGRLPVVPKGARDALSPPNGGCLPVEVRQKADVNLFDSHRRQRTSDSLGVTSRTVAVTLGRANGPVSQHSLPRLVRTFETDASRLLAVKGVNLRVMPVDHAKRTSRNIDTTTRMSATKPQQSVPAKKKDFDFRV